MGNWLKVGLVGLFALSLSGCLAAAAAGAAGGIYFEKHYKIEKKKHPEKAQKTQHKKAKPQS